MEHMTAFVIWTKPNYIAVICPLCWEEEIHVFDFQESQTDKVRPTILKASCSHSGDMYRAIFPREIDCGWEKNWAAGRLDVVGLDLSEVEIEGTWNPTSFEIPEPPAGGTLTDKRSTCGSAIRMKPRIVLGDLKKIITIRIKPNSTEIRAPSATVGGLPLVDPLEVLNSHRQIYKKTNAVLVRGGPFDPIIAVSGWLEAFRNPRNTLKQTVWVNQVFKVCEYVGHELESEGRDKLRPGQVKASHAEKQLIAFTVRMHRYMDDGYEPNYMYKLRNLPSDLREVWIAIDNEPCSDCMRFRDKVEAVLIIKIHFVKMEKEFTFGVYLHDQNMQRPRTPTRAKEVGFSLSTPPDSGNRVSDDDTTYLEDGEDSDYDGSGNDQPPCRERNLRFLGTPQRPIMIQPSPPSSPTPRSRQRETRNKGREIQPTAASQSIPQVSPIPSANTVLSNADVKAAIAEAYELMAQQEDEVEEEIEEEIGEALRRKITIDLTLDELMDNDDSEGSVFYPDTE